ncbi:MAG: PspC domain-containing protein [Bacteroidales bacterium]|nr:PspC domain-containing protein [Bacteroidales bacterium]
MKKTLTINLAGLVFNIDEDAYSKLKEYLETIEAQFSNEQDPKEIMTDIESRIAELLNSRKPDKQQAVTIEDINEIITIMGNPDEFADEEKSNGQTYTSRKGYRRMYRDPDSRIIGGVCSGLGAYWSIDPSIIRIVFVVLTIFGFAGVLIYLILWIVLPEANTVAQKLEMRGEPVNVNNIRDFFKEEFENVKRGMNFKSSKK